LRNQQAANRRAGRRTGARPGSAFARRLALCATGLLVACDSLVGPAAEQCGSGARFTSLPVAESDINAITVIGGLGAPIHTLPTDHAGIYLARENVSVQAPGDVQVTGIRRTTYLASPRRQGRSDFSLEFQSCRQITGWFGHLTTLSSAIPVERLDWEDCDRYSTADETVETCRAEPSKLLLRAGEPMGTGGMSAALGLLALDVGLLDSRVNNFYTARQRYHRETFRAVCPWEQFDAANQAVLFSRLRDLSRPGTVASGQPRCGTMEVDMPGTVKGVWAETGVTGPVAGDERRYITLADYPYRPQDQLALSLGPVGLGAAVFVVPRMTSGRVNRAFEQVPSDGLIYCYGPDSAQPVSSWLISLSANTLSIERRTHALAASPCLAAPATWSFTANAIQMVR
jgi:hypothetical protein